MKQVFFINNAGAGFADNITVDDDMTIGRLFNERLHGQRASSFKIKVNGNPVNADYVLQPQDRVSVTPVKIEGASLVNITFINNTGAGFAGEKTVDYGTTVSQLFQQELGSSARASNYKVKVNGQPVAADYRLNQGDRVSITPVKIEGARA